MQFFWDKNTKTKSKSRFNLLLLEYGEYYFEDFSTYLYPVPSNDESGDVIDTFVQCDSMKIQGRLKLCSRSIIFEPNDSRKPLMKFLFKHIKSDIIHYELTQTQLQECSTYASGFLTFSTSCYYEMKANDKISPYKQMDINTYSSSHKSTESFSPSSSSSSSSSSSINKIDIPFDPTTNTCRILLAIVHSDLDYVTNRIKNMKYIYEEGNKHYTGDQLLQPLIYAASRNKFDTSQLVNFHEKLLLREPFIVNKIKPLIMYPGCMMITESRVYFQPAQLNYIGGDHHNHNSIFAFDQITRIYKRRYLLQQIGLEIFCSDETSSLFVFTNTLQRDQMYDIIIQHRHTHSYTSSTPSLEEIIRKWQKREISNFDYLMHLNIEADRSMNDLTQYPVFPHVLIDYTSTTLDIHDNNIYRDLSKPIGALNSTRLNAFRERYLSMVSLDDTNNKTSPPPFLYGTHYSTPGYVLFYLVRVAPEHMLCLQNGKFDISDRMFTNIKDMWNSCYHNPADLKELIPEFYCSQGEFLINKLNLNLGIKHTGEKLGDVELPPWASDPLDFITKCRQALESDYVSSHIHEWIDLIFGYKQTGPAAVDANNVFFYLTYEGSIDFKTMNNPFDRKAIELQIQEFGQTPKQLFNGPHPCRNSTDYSIPIPIKLPTSLKEESKISSPLSRLGNQLRRSRPENDTQTTTATTTYSTYISNTASSDSASKIKSTTTATPTTNIQSKKRWNFPNLVTRSESPALLMIDAQNTSKDTYQSGMNTTMEIQEKENKINQQKGHKLKLTNQSSSSSSTWKTTHGDPSTTTTTTATTTTTHNNIIANNNTNMKGNNKIKNSHLSYKATSYDSSNNSNSRRGSESSLDDEHEFLYMEELLDDDENLRRAIHQELSTMSIQAQDNIQIPFNNNNDNVSQDRVSVPMEILSDMKQNLLNIPSYKSLQSHQSNHSSNSISSEVTIHLQQTKSPTATSNTHNNETNNIIPVRTQRIHPATSVLQDSNDIYKDTNEQPSKSVSITDKVISSLPTFITSNTTFISVWNKWGKAGPNTQLIESVNQPTEYYASANSPDSRSIPEESSQIYMDNLINTSTTTSNNNNDMNHLPNSMNTTSNSRKLHQQLEIQKHVYDNYKPYLYDKFESYDDGDSLDGDIDATTAYHNGSVTSDVISEYVVTPEKTDINRVLSGSSYNTLFTEENDISRSSSHSPGYLRISGDKYINQNTSIHNNQMSLLTPNRVMSKSSSFRKTNTCASLPVSPPKSPLAAHISPVVTTFTTNEIQYEYPVANNLLNTVVDKDLNTIATDVNQIVGTENTSGNTDISLNYPIQTSYQQMNGESSSTDRDDTRRISPITTSQCKPNNDNYGTENTDIPHKKPINLPSLDINEINSTTPHPNFSTGTTTTATTNTSISTNTNIVSLPEESEKMFSTATFIDLNQMMLQPYEPLKLHRDCITGLCLKLNINTNTSSSSSSSSSSGSSHVSGGNMNGNKRLSTDSALEILNESNLTKERPPSGTFSKYASSALSRIRHSTGTTTRPTETTDHTLSPKSNSNNNNGLSSDDLLDESVMNLDQATINNNTTTSTITTTTTTSSTPLSSSMNKTSSRLDIISFILSTCSKDATLKIIDLQIDRNIHLHSMNPLMQSTMFQSKVRRTFYTAGGSTPLSSCMLTNDGKTAYASSWDNSVYIYSIPTSASLGKRQAHKDSISCACMDMRNEYILTGSWDTSVKLWAIKSSTGLLSPSPTAEFYDHEESVVCVALESMQCTYVSAGSENGTVIIWETKTMSIVGQVTLNSDSVVTCMQWLPLVDFHDSCIIAPCSLGPTRPHEYTCINANCIYSRERLICATNDGVLTYMDFQGNIIASLKVDAYIRCLTITTIQNTTNTPSEIQVIPTQENGYATINVASPKNDNNSSSNNNNDMNTYIGKSSHHILIIGGCEDGSLRIWSLHAPPTCTPRQRSVATSPPLSPTSSSSSTTINTNTQTQTQTCTSIPAFYEIYRINSAHSKACTSVTSYDHVVVSGSIDGIVRIWKIIIP